MSNSTTTGSTLTSVVDTTITSTSSSDIASVVTEISTITSSSSTLTSTSESTTSISTVVSSTYVTPSTTTEIPTSTSSFAPATTPSTVVTSVVTQTPSANGSTQPPVVVTLTSTAPQPSATPTEPSTTSSSSSSSASSTPSALGVSGGGSSSSGSLSSGGKIAIAVVIPIVVIALAIALGLFFFKRRRRTRNDNAMRQKEMAEYGYNPNNDPMLVPAGAAAYTDNVSETEDNSGYRGWGNTSTQRQPSTTMGSGKKGAVGGMAVSDTSSNGAHVHGPSSGQPSELYSGETLANGQDGIGPLGGAAAAGMVGGAGVGRKSSNNRGVNREPSNASSAYSSGRAVSDVSDEVPGVPGPYYHEEAPYNIYNDAQSPQGPYTEGPYAGRGGQPVIQNVGARRDTRIERVPTFPQQQGNSGIAQNF